MKRSWLIAGAVVGCLSGAAVGACGSSSGAGGSGGNVSGVTSNTVASGKTSTGTGSVTTGNGVTSTVNSVSATSGAGGGQCSTVGTLHPPKADAGADTLYCPFSGVDGGANASCDPSMEHCCEYPANGMQSGCDPAATACDVSASVDWVCEDPVADCPANMDCCAAGASIGLGTPGCGNFAHTMKSTACVAKGACTAGIIMCTSDSECPAATPTCTPFSKAGAQVGGCM